MFGLSILVWTALVFCGGALFGHLAPKFAVWLWALFHKVDPQLPK